MDVPFRPFKYGPLGNTVNLASRVQGATRYLQAPILLTGGTRAQLGDGVPARRLGRVAVVNVAEPVQLFELTAERSGWAALYRGYEQALAEFERRDFREAARTLGNLLTSHPGDGPSLAPPARAVQELIEGPATFDPVWRMPGK